MIAVVLCLSRTAPSASRPHLQDSGQGGWIRTTGFLLPEQAVWPLTYTLCLASLKGVEPLTSAFVARRSSD